mmetsp:Transcript_8474/g.24207  ORF Transcript_8474/g.24207 Transcript_8474/m.24207 type:complete len:355 (+) Transcript_8474:1888-2952(+)
MEVLERVTPPSGRGAGREESPTSAGSCVRIKSRVHLSHLNLFREESFLPVGKPDILQSIRFCGYNDLSGELRGQFVGPGLHADVLLLRENGVVHEMKQELRRALLQKFPAQSTAIRKPYHHTHYVLSRLGRLRPELSLESRLHLLLSVLLLLLPVTLFLQLPPLLRFHPLLGRFFLLVGSQGGVECPVLLHSDLPLRSHLGVHAAAADGVPIRRCLRHWPLVRNAEHGSLQHFGLLGVDAVRKHNVLHRRARGLVLGVLRIHHRGVHHVLVLGRNLLGGVAVGPLEVVGHVGRVVHNPKVVVGFHPPRTLLHGGVLAEVRRGPGVRTGRHHRKLPRSPVSVEPAGGGCSVHHAA